MKKLAIMLVVLVFAVAAVFALPVYAADKEVMVMNEPNVNVINTPDVYIVNDETDPVRVTSDIPAREPFQFYERFSDYVNFIGRETLFRVPNDKRFVIETIGFSASRGMAPDVDITAPSIVHTGYYPNTKHVAAPPLLEIAATGTFAALHQVRIYVEPAEYVYVTINGKGDWNVMISGYYLPSDSSSLAP